MNKHDATEIAFKNGYKKAAREIFADIEEHSTLLFDGVRNIVVMTETDFEKIKEKYTEDSDES